MFYATVHGRRVSYERSGAGPPVVLLHGLGDSHLLWRRQLEMLTEAHDTVAIDLPGHGTSEPVQGVVTLGLMAGDVRAVIEALALRSPVLVGLSMGGGVAQTLAIREPALPRALVLVSTSSEFPDETRRRMRRRAARAEREGMAAVIEETVPRWFTARFMKLHPEEVAVTQRTLLATSPQAFAAASRANAARQLTSQLGRISCPVLFVGGTEDPAAPARAVEIYRRRLRDVRVALIPSASHLVPIEASTEFNTILRGFLEQLDG